MSLMDTDAATEPPSASLMMFMFGSIARIPSITFLYRVRYNYVSTTSGKVKTIMRTSTDYSSIVNHLETTASNRPISDVQIVEYDVNGDEYQIRYNVQTFDSDADDFL